MHLHVHLVQRLLSDMMSCAISVSSFFPSRTSLKHVSFADHADYFAVKFRHGHPAKTVDDHLGCDIAGGTPGGVVARTGLLITSFAFMAAVLLTVCFLL